MCVAKSFVSFVLKPEQFGGPVTRMEATTRARVNLTFVETTLQVFYELAGACVGPGQHRSCVLAGGVNSDEGVPER